VNNEIGTGPLGEITCVRGDIFAVSDVAGDILPGGDHGVYVRDTRMLDHLEVLVDGARPRPLRGASIGPASAAFHGYVPIPGGGPDPSLLVERRRVIDGVLHEEIHLTNLGDGDLRVEVGLRVGTDFAYIFDVRHDRVLDRLPVQDTTGGARFVRTDLVDELIVTTDPPPVRREDDLLVVVCEVAAGERATVCADLTATDVYGTVRPNRRCAALDPSNRLPPSLGDRSPLAVRCSDERFARLVERSLDDLAALRLSDPEEPADAFCAAGSPWYLTLFGRDSLWAAFMAVPFDLDLAGGTLRTLARRQGARHDRDTEEQPGKILHEIRRGSLTHRGDLPPNYYGSVDATPLFVVLAHEAWRWGLPSGQVTQLLPHVESALAWLRDFGDPDGDGFIEYIKDSDRGLDNQGWKDSQDGIQFADGRLARPPIALAEVQGYAYDAAVRGAELLEHFGRPEADTWRRWADELAARFRARFWLTGPRGAYPAIALDGDDRPVDGPASNMGHLLASGLLSPEESRAVGTHLAGEELASGWGLRTLSTTSAGFNPLSYHAGSVWPHDTAIAAWGLALTDQPEAASLLLRGLVDAAPGFGFRLPELFAGFSRADVPFPVPYPAACRPQAWAAGGALLLLRACLRLQPDLPDGRLTIAPLRPPPFQFLEVEGLPVGGRFLSLRVDGEGRVEVDVQGEPLRLELA
jgi:glycogen debranching enzyme